MSLGTEADRVSQPRIVRNRADIKCSKPGAARSLEQGKILCSGTESSKTRIHNLHGRVLFPATFFGLARTCEDQATSSLLGKYGRSFYK